MKREVVSGAGLPPQIGPYSHAVSAGGFVFVSGQPGVDPEIGGTVVNPVEARLAPPTIRVEVC